MNDLTLVAALVGAGTGIASLAMLLALSLRLRDRFRFLDRQLTTLDPRKPLANAEARLKARITEAELDIGTRVAISDLGLRFPLFLGDWSVDPLMAKFLVQHLVAESPQTIVELGGGSSTVLIARMQEVLGRGGYQHIAIDHEERYLEATRRLTAAHGLDTRVQFALAPLADRAFNGAPWYSGVDTMLAGKRIDLLIVDGPPGTLTKDARYPAVPALRELLAEGATIVLDDYSREEEQSIVRRWLAEHPGLELQMEETRGHGFAVVRRR